MANWKDEMARWEDETELEYIDRMTDNIHGTMWAEGTKDEVKDTVMRLTKDLISEIRPDIHIKVLEDKGWAITEKLDAVVEREAKVKYESWVRVSGEDFLYATLFLTQELGDQLTSPFAVYRSTTSVKAYPIHEIIIEKRSLGNHTSIEGFTRTSKKERLFFLSSNAFSWYEEMAKHAREIDYEEKHGVNMKSFRKDVLTGEI
jgi:hypothetical protein